MGGHFADGEGETALSCFSVIGNRYMGWVWRCDQVIIYFQPTHGKVRLVHINRFFHTIFHFLVFKQETYFPVCAAFCKKGRGSVGALDTQNVGSVGHVGHHLVHIQQLVVAVSGGVYRFFERFLSQFFVQFVNPNQIGIVACDVVLFVCSLVHNQHGVIAHVAVHIRNLHNQFYWHTSIPVRNRQLVGVFKKVKITVGRIGGSFVGLIPFVRCNHIILAPSCFIIQRRHLALV